MKHNPELLPLQDGLQVSAGRRVQTFDPHKWVDNHSWPTASVTTKALSSTCRLPASLHLWKSCCRISQFEYFSKWQHSWFSKISNFWSVDWTIFCNARLHSLAESQLLLPSMITVFHNLVQSPFLLLSMNTFKCQFSEFSSITIFFYYIRTQCHVECHIS